MPAASPGIYQAFGMLLSSPSLALPELMPATAVAPSGSESLVELVEADHQQWPTLQASPHSTPTLQLAPQDWRLELEGIGWFRATGGERLEWQRWDDSVSDRDIRTFAVTSGLGALAIQRGALVLHGTALERDGESILLLGHPAAGKSTLAWCLLQGSGVGECQCSDTTQGERQADRALHQPTAIGRMLGKRLIPSSC